MEEFDRRRQPIRQTFVPECLWRPQNSPEVTAKERHMYCITMKSVVLETPSLNLRRYGSPLYGPYLKRGIRPDFT